MDHDENDDEQGHNTEGKHEMDVELAAEEAKKEIEESILEIEEDTQELALFLACSMSQPK